MWTERKIVTQLSLNCARNVMVDGRLDYCNSVLYGTSAMNLNKLQRFQNSAARIVTGSRRSEHALPILAELHWLSIKHRIDYKIAGTVFKVLTTPQPIYLGNIIRFRTALRQLRSCGRNLLHDGRTNLAFADRAFSDAAPAAVWNSLPLDIVSDLSCLATFKRLVKTELYNQAYLRWFVTTRTYDSSLCERPNVRHQPRNNNNNNNMVSWQCSRNISTRVHQEMRYLNVSQMPYVTLNLY